MTDSATATDGRERPDNVVEFQKPKPANAGGAAEGSKTAGDDLCARAAKLARGDTAGAEAFIKTAVGLGLPESAPYA